MIFLVSDRIGYLPQSSRDCTFAFSNPTTQYSSSTDLIVWHQPEPRGKTLCSREFIDIIPKIRHQAQNSIMALPHLWRTNLSQRSDMQF